MAFYSTGIARYDGHTMETLRHRATASWIRPCARSSRMPRIACGWPPRRAWPSPRNRWTLTDRRARALRLASRRCGADARAHAAQLRRGRARRLGLGEHAGRHPPLSLRAATAAQSRPCRRRAPALAHVRPARRNAAGQPRQRRDRRDRPATDQRVVARVESPATALSEDVRRHAVGRQRGRAGLEARERRAARRQPRSRRAHRGAAAPTRDGRHVWAASLGTGAVRIDRSDPAQRLVVTRANGLLGETLWTILEDREGNLWFGQNGGASRLRKGYGAFFAWTERSVARRCPIPARSRCCRNGAARLGRPPAAAWPR